MSPSLVSFLGGILEAVVRAIVGALRSSSDAEALEVARRGMLDAIGHIESAQAREKFPGLREDG